jgi:hypothetical protein
MPPYFAILFLIVYHLFSSSASFLKAVKVSEELSPSKSMTASTIGSQVTSLNTSLIPLAAFDGQLAATSEYSDSSCNNLIYTSVTALNVCVRIGVSEYLMPTATSSSVLYSTYSDPSCSLLVASSAVTNTNGACVDGRKVFISSEMKYTAVDATAKLR